MKQIRGKRAETIIRSATFCSVHRNNIQGEETSKYFALKEYRRARSDGDGRLYDNGDGEYTVEIHLNYWFKIISKFA